MYNLIPCILYMYLTFYFAVKKRNCWQLFEGPIQPLVQCQVHRNTVLPHQGPTPHRFHPWLHHGPSRSLVGATPHHLKVSPCLNQPLIYFQLQRKTYILIACSLPYSYSCNMYRRRLQVRYYTIYRICTIGN